MLESLILYRLRTRHTRSFTQQLCTALPLGYNLKILRYYICFMCIKHFYSRCFVSLELELGMERFITDIFWIYECMGLILDALSKCSSLVQLYLIAPGLLISNPPFNYHTDGQVELFCNAILRLVESLTNLTCLYSISNDPDYCCVAASKLLIATVARKRPSFCAEILGGKVRRIYNSMPSVPNGMKKRLQ